MAVSYWSDYAERDEFRGRARRSDHPRRSVALLVARRCADCNRTTYQFEWRNARIGRFDSKQASMAPMTPHLAPVMLRNRLFIVLVFILEYVLAASAMAAPASAKEQV